MHVREQKQLNPVQDEVLALTAVVRPILAGTLYALKADIVQEAGGYENLKLKMLPRLYRAGDGDCGICFEYAVHEAISRGDGSVLERMTDAAKLCRLEGDRPKSILLGLEKSGTQQLIDTAGDFSTCNRPFRDGHHSGRRLCNSTTSFRRGNHSMVRTPSISAFREVTEAGVLVSYGRTPWSCRYRRAAGSRHGRRCGRSGRSAPWRRRSPCGARWRRARPPSSSRASPCCAPARARRTCRPRGAAAPGSCRSARRTVC